MHDIVPISFVLVFHACGHCLARDKLCNVLPFRKAALEQSTIILLLLLHHIYTPGANYLTAIVLVRMNVLTAGVDTSDSAVISNHSGELVVHCVGTTTLLPQHNIDSCL